MSIPPSLFQVYLYGLLAASCFTAGLFATSLLFQWNSLRLGLLGVALLATGAALARRWHHLRLAATAFLAGVLAAGTLVVVVVLGEVAGL